MPSLCIAELELTELGFIEIDGACADCTFEPVFMVVVQGHGGSQVLCWARPRVQEIDHASLMLLNVHGVSLRETLRCGDRPVDEGREERLIL